MTGPGQSASEPALTRRALLALGSRAFVLGALALVGCGRDVDDETPAATAPPPTSSPTPRPAVALPEGPDKPNEISIEVVGEPPQDQLVLVEHAAGLAREFFARELGFYLDGPVVINVVHLPDLPLHAATFLRDGERISSITVNVGQRTWELETPLERTKVVAHEYFHVLQNWLRSSTDTAGEPLFLVEGSAEYAGYATAIDSGLLTWEDFRGGLVDQLQAQRVLLPRLERLVDEGPLALTGYRLAALAIDRLVGTLGIVPLAQYTLLRRELTPEPAFEAVFGATLPSFYADFALWRRVAGL